MLIAKYFAISDLMNMSHGSYWQNMRFYFDPILTKLVPVGFDGYHGEEQLELKEISINRNFIQNEKGIELPFFKDNSGDDIEAIAQVPEEGHDHHHHDHGGLDPHIWHDPHNINSMAEIVKNKLKSRIGLFNGNDRNLVNARFESVDLILEDCLLGIRFPF